jgi:hypothetical protein
MAAVEAARWPIFSSRRSTSDGDCRLGIGDALPLAEHQQQVGDVAVADEQLAAADDDAVAIGAEAGFHARGVRSRFGLGDGERAQGAGGDARQEALLLRLRADVDQRLHAVEGGRVDDPGGGARLGDGADAFQVELVADRRAAIGLRQEDHVHAEVVQRLDVLPRELAGAVILGGARGDLFLTQPAHLIEDQLLFLVPRPAPVETFEDLH